MEPCLHLQSTFCLLLTHFLGTSSALFAWLLHLFVKCMMWAVLSSIDHAVMIFSGPLALPGSHGNPKKFFAGSRIAHHSYKSSCLNYLYSPRSMSNKLLSEKSSFQNSGIFWQLYDAPLNHLGITINMLCCNNFLSSTSDFRRVKDHCE